MYNETKIAVRKAFDIGRILFFMGPERYGRLLSATQRIRPPTTDDVSELVNNGMPLEDAIISLLRKRYKSAAVEAGFTEEQGIAMLEYAAMLEELK